MDADIVLSSSTPTVTSQEPAMQSDSVRPDNTVPVVGVSSPALQNPTAAPAAPVLHPLPDPPVLSGPGQRILAYLQQYDPKVNIGDYTKGHAIEPKGLAKLRERGRLYFGVFGYGGHGKSAYLNTLRAAMRVPSDAFAARETSHNIYQANVRTGKGTEAAESYVSSTGHGTQNYQPFFINETKNTIVLYDTRGLNFVRVSDVKKLVRYLWGQGCAGFMEWDREAVDASPDWKNSALTQLEQVYDNNTTTFPLSSIAIAVSALADDMVVKNIKILIVNLRKIQWTSFVVVITMVDLQTTPKDKYEDLRTQWAERLDVESDVVFLSCNYQRRKENKRDAYFEEQALQSLVKMIELSEKGADYRPPGYGEEVLKTAGVQLGNATGIVNRAWRAGKGSPMNATAYLLLGILIIYFLFMRRVDI